MKVFAFAALALFVATPAQADWQGFKWGMQEKQVEQANSEVEVYRLDIVKRWRFRPIAATLGGRWAKDGHDYEVSFFFNEKGKLELLEIEPMALECRDQNAAFAKRFGDFEEEIKPLGPAQRIIRRWQVGKSAELMTLVIHFPSSDKWICKSTIKKPIGR